MQVDVAGLRVMVTGGGDGIGRAIAERFQAHHAHVHVCDLAPERLGVLQGIGGTVADVSDAIQVANWFAEAQAALGGLDVLVNNAGIAGPAAAVEDIAPEDWEQTLRVNTNGPFYCSRLAVPLLKAAGGGSIVNISSTAGLFGYPLRAPYAASKWAVIGFTKTLAMELGAFGIRVNAICPGSMTNPRMDAIIEREAEAQGVSAQQVREGYVQQVSMRTFIAPQEIADVVLFLCSNAGKHISGQALSVDGHTETLRT